MPRGAVDELPGRCIASAAVSTLAGENKPEKKRTGWPSDLADKAEEAVGEPDRCGGRSAILLFRDAPRREPGQSGCPEGGRSLDKLGLLDYLQSIRPGLSPSRTAESFSRGMPS